MRAALRATRDLEYAFVVTGPYADVPFFLGANKDPGYAGGSFDVKQRRAVLLGDGKGGIGLVTCGEYVVYSNSVLFVGLQGANGCSVGKFVVHALTHWEKARGRALKLNSFTTTPDEILAEFEKQTGEKWGVEYTPLDKLRELEKEAWEKGQPDATGLTLRRIWTEGGTLYERRDNEDIGAENTVTLAGAVKDAIRAQLS